MKLAGGECEIKRGESPLLPRQFIALLIDVYRQYAFGGYVYLTCII